MTFAAPRFALRKPSLLGSAALSSLLLWSLGCATNPATGKSQLALIGEAREIELGRDSDREIVASLGLVDDAELQSYVSRLGHAVADSSERPGLPWTFRVVDDPVVNAFALPGGYVYVTRGLLGHLTSEAELVSVLGHEIGHVTARHSVEQISRQQLAQIGLLGVAIARPDFGRYADLAQTGLGLMFLKYGRDDERQADELGLRYLVQAGYNPREMPPVFATLKRASEAQGGGRVPGWLSTHPTEESRIQSISRGISGYGRDWTGSKVNRDGYLARLDGLAFGDDPREGYFLRANRFIHPGLGFEIRFPEGWKAENQKQRVAAVSPAEDAIVELTLAKEASPEAAARAFYALDGITRGESVGRGGRASLVANRFEAQGQQATLYGIAGFVSQGRNVFQVLGYTREGRWQELSDSLADAVLSFGPVSEPRLLRVEPKRIEIVELPETMTIEEFARRYPSTVETATLAIINQVEAGATLAAGTHAKRVRGGELPR